MKIHEKVNYEILVSDENITTLDSIRLELKKNEISKLKSIEELLFFLEKQTTSETLQYIKTAHHQAYAPMDSTDETTVIRYDIGWVTGELFLQFNDLNYNLLFSLVIYTRSWDGLFDVLKNYLEKEKIEKLALLNAQELEDIDFQAMVKNLVSNVTSIIEPLQKSPEKIAYNSTEYKMYWKEYIQLNWDKDDLEILNYWNNTFRQHQFFHSSELLALLMLVPWCIDDFALLCDGFKIPTQIDNVLYSKKITSNTQLLLELVKKSPTVLSAEQTWNKSILILEIIEILLNQAEKLERDSQHESMIDLITKATKIFITRKDGKFLSKYIWKHYYSCLLDSLEYNSPKVIVYENFLDLMALEIKDNNFITKYQFCNNKNESYNIFSRCDSVSFLPPQFDFSDLAILKQTDNISQECAIKAFHEIIACSSQVLGTSAWTTVLPDKRHFLVGELYLTNSLENWKKTWLFLANAIYKAELSQGGEYTELMYRIKFALCAELSTYSMLSKKEGYTATVEALGEHLWKYLFNLYVVHGVYEEDFWKRLFCLWIIVTQRIASKRHADLSYEKIFKKTCLHKLKLFQDDYKIISKIMIELYQNIPSDEQNNFNMIITQKEMKHFFNDCFKIYFERLNREFPKPSFEKKTEISIINKFKTLTM